MAGIARWGPVRARACALVGFGRVGINPAMGAVGAAGRAGAFRSKRGSRRIAFGRPLAELGGNLDIIADARMQIEQARLLVLKAAWMIDKFGAKGAYKEIAMIKALTPQMHAAVCDRAIQVFGAEGLSPDTPLADHWTWARCLRFADGPDEVHRMVVGRHELRKYAEQKDVNATFRDGCCLLYTSDAADERSSVDLGGRRIIKKKKPNDSRWTRTPAIA